MRKLLVQKITKQKSISLKCPHERHISWQWNEKSSSHYKGAPTKGKSAHSKVPGQAPRSVSHWVVCYARMQVLTAGETSQALLWVPGSGAKKSPCFWQLQPLRSKINAQERPKSPQLLHIPGYPDMISQLSSAKYRALFSSRKLCYNGKNIPTDVIFAFNS